MNKQELKAKIEQLPHVGAVYNPNNCINRQVVLSLVEGLSEPEQVVVPAKVAEWIEKCKENGYVLVEAIDLDLTPPEVDAFLVENCDCFARAWLDGYVVADVTRYTVAIPNPHGAHKYSYLAKKEEGVAILSTDDRGWRSDSRCQLTEAEIRKDFDWAWQEGFAKEVKDDTEV